MRRIYLTEDQVSDLVDAIRNRRDDCEDNARFYPSEAEDMKAAVSRLEELERALCEPEEAPFEPSGFLLLDDSEEIQYGDLCERVDGGAWVEARVWVPVDKD